MEKKKLAQAIGAIFVALIFLSSYATMGSKGGGSTPTTTVPQVQTVYATARGAATVASYGSVMEINISCANVTTVFDKINSILSSMQSNGTIANFYYQQASQILVQAGSASNSSFTLYKQLANAIGDGFVCTTFSSSAGIQLPNTMRFYAPIAKTDLLINIPADRKSYTVPFIFTSNLSKTINVSVSALITVNGTLFGNMTVIKT